MNKKISFVLACILVCCVLFSSCAKEDTPYDVAFVGASQCYVDFLERAMVDWRDAIQTYCYCDDAAVLEKTLEGPPITSYEIICFKKYSDQLWEAELFSTAEYNPDGAYVAHYVALIDGKYRVILNLKYIPEELTNGLELEPYLPQGPGIVNPDDIIG